MKRLEGLVMRDATSPSFLSSFSFSYDKALSTPLV